MSPGRGDDQQHARPEGQLRQMPEHRRVFQAALASDLRTAAARYPADPGRWQVTIGAYRTTLTVTTYSLRNRLYQPTTSCMGVNHLRSVGVLYVWAVPARPSVARHYARLGTNLT
jgi:hypothetical protein